jgi:hypothetical protein
MKSLCMAGKRFDSAFGHAIDHRQPYRWAFDSTVMPLASPKVLFIP